jgi:hypothetical protein
MHSDHRQEKTRRQERDMRWNLAIKIIGIVIFIGVILNINVREVASRLAGVNPVAVSLAFLVFIPLVLVKTFRLVEIIRINGEKLGFGKAVAIYWIGIFYGTFTPGRLGELLKIMYLKKNRIGGFNAFFSTIFDRVFDLGIIAGLGYIFMLIFFSDFSDYVMLFSVIVLASIAVLAVAWFLRQNIWNLLYRFYFSKKTKLTKKELDRKARGFISRYSISRILYLIFITVVAYGFHFLMAYFLATSLGIPLGYFKIVALMSITVLITLIPISFNGIGTREATLIFLFGLVGLSSELAVSFSLLIFVSYIIVAIPGLVILMLQKNRQQNG